MLDDGKILVTGGAGFIGSAIVWGLNKRGVDNILIADFLERSEKWRNLAALRFKDYMEADDLALLLERTPGALHGVKTVFHLGASSSTTETNAAFLIRNNFEYTKRLAAWALANGARFVYASSAATYGALESDLSEKRDLHSLRPLNMYGYSKQLFDVHASTEGYLDKITGLKYFNVFGPNEDHKGDMRSMVHKAFHQIRDTGKVRLFKSYRPDVKDGEQRRDFLYVKDAVEMTLHLADDPRRCGLFNVGSGLAASWLELSDAVFAAMGRSPEIEFIDMPETLRPKYQYFTKADIARLRASGYAQEVTPLREAVADYVTNYLQPSHKLGDEPKTSAPDGRARK
ncbi:MAG TPA: ADP-glyceromanno-heptose 6-epimerase [Candidatus Acidoferrales bacterium]|nr:ADP-glyceromanno-heptose 6-epimerase [Candidatus Acidoferrales bacterium]